MLGFLYFLLLLLPSYYREHHLHCHHLRWDTNNLQFFCIMRSSHFCLPSWNHWFVFSPYKHVMQSWFSIVVCSLRSAKKWERSKQAKQPSRQEVLSLWQHSFFSMQYITNKVTAIASRPTCCTAAYILRKGKRTRNSSDVVMAEALWIHLLLSLPSFFFASLPPQYWGFSRRT